jgi:hypothetical protein
MASVHIVQQPRTAQQGRKLEPLKSSDNAFVVVRRTGLPPLRFSGERMLGEASRGTKLALNYEINLFRRSKGGYVVETKCVKKPGGTKDMFRAEQCATIGEVMNWIEQYDPRYDMEPDFKVEDSRPTVELVLEAVALRQKIDELRAEYESVSTSVLETLVEFDPSC